MRFWRISNYADLSGEGGRRFPARWHHAGRPIVYCAEHPAGALTEHLVHLDWDLLPDRFQLLTLDVADGVRIDEIAPGTLPPDWRTDLAATRAAGDRWLASQSSLLCRVPSVILPGVHNALINPAHPDMPKIIIAKAESVPLDGRLGPRRS